MIQIVDGTWARTNFSRCVPFPRDVNLRYRSILSILLPCHRKLVIDIGMLDRYRTCGRWPAFARGGMSGDVVVLQRTSSFTCRDVVGSDPSEKELARASP